MIDDPTEIAAVGPTFCSDCAEVVHPSETVCAGCGTHLDPKRFSSAVGGTTLDGTSAADGLEVSVMTPHDCTCGGRAICTACVLAEYERDPMAQALERATTLVIDGHGNVIDIDDHRGSRA